MPSAVVVGAGVFGGSLARRLAAAGWQVTLVEQYTPGHVRAASGGESRLIRFAHGPGRWYTQSARRARELWADLEHESGTQLLVPAGVAWLARREDGWEAESERILGEEGVPAEHLSLAEATRFFPSFNPHPLAPSNSASSKYGPRVSFTKLSGAYTAWITRVASCLFPSKVKCENFV